MPPIRRMALLGALVACAVTLAACGTASEPEAHVQLQITSPLDGLRVTNDSVTVKGSVAPAGATVMVLGQRAAVTRGTFTARVPLAPGSNLVDVLAGAARAQAVMTAVRVYRQVLITIPNLDNDSPSAATQTLQVLGLRAHVQDKDSFLAVFLPESPSVCGTSPGAGHRVAPGTLVTVDASKTC